MAFLGLDFLQANKYVLSADSGLRLNNKKYSTIVQKVPFRVIRGVMSANIMSSGL